MEKLAAFGENQDWVGNKALKLSRKLSSLFPQKRGMGCCGAVALPGATADGHLLHGRNMDYDGMGFFDRFPTIAFCKPDEGQPFAWIASAGVHTAGLTAMNASGLFLGANTAPTTQVSIKGLSLFSLNDRVIRKARSFSEGIDLLTNMKPATGYNIHLSHGPSNQAGVVEVSAESHVVRYPTDDLLAITNHYETKSLAETIPEFTIVDHYNSLSRRERLKQLLYKKSPEHTVQTIAGCLRDQKEPDTLETHPLGDVLCNYMNVSSVVADVTQGRLYVGSQPAPSALGRYIDFDFHKEMDSFLSPRAYPIEDIAPSPARMGSMGDSVREYISAHVELTHRHRSKDALGHLERCLEALPKEPRALLSAGLLSLHEGLLDDARGYATKYLETVPENYPRRHRAYMLKAWCDDLTKKRVSARKNRKNAQTAAEASGDPTAETEIRRFGRKRFTERDRKKMDIDLFNAKNFPI